VRTTVDTVRQQAREYTDAQSTVLRKALTSSITDLLDSKADKVDLDAVAEAATQYTDVKMAELEVTQLNRIAPVHLLCSPLGLISEVH